MRGMSPPYRARLAPASAPVPALVGFYFLLVVERPAGVARLYPKTSGFCFVPMAATKQIRGGMKPFSAWREGMAKPPLVTKAATKRQAKKANRQGTVMIKALSAIAVAAFVAAALTVLPGFAPQVEASTPHVLAKGDRLDYHPVGRSCSE